MRPVLACLTILFLAGCGRKPESSLPVASSSPESAATNAVMPVATAGSGASSDAVDLAALLGELTQALRKYSFEHQRLPKTFDELAGAGYVKNLPQAPAGKRFEIDPKKVQIVVVKQ